MDGNYNNNRPDEEYKETSSIEEEEHGKSNEKIYIGEDYREPVGKKKKRSCKGRLFSYIIVV